MVRIIVVSAFTLIGLGELTSAAAQQDFDAQLKMIRETAADICYTVDQRGRKSDAQLTGEVQAQVNGIISKLFDLSGKASGNIGSQEYRGVSQEALATALKESANCRERVLNKLLDRIRPLSSASPSPAPLQPSNPTLHPALPNQPRQPWQYNPTSMRSACVQGNGDACIAFADSCLQGNKNDACNDLLGRAYDACLNLRSERERLFFCDLAQRLSSK
jgi:hypothetical protein